MFDDFSSNIFSADGETVKTIIRRYNDENDVRIVSPKIAESAAIEIIGPIAWNSPTEISVSLMKKEAK